MIINFFFYNMSSKLLFLYEEDPCSFDLKHQAYKDIQIRENVYENKFQ